MKLGPIQQKFDLHWGENGHPPGNQPHCGSDAHFGDFLKDCYKALKIMGFRI